jgi:hypothetical protein
VTTRLRRPIHVSRARACGTRVVERRNEFLRSPDWHSAREHIGRAKPLLACTSERALGVEQVVVAQGLVSRGAAASITDGFRIARRAKPCAVVLQVRTVAFGSTIRTTSAAANGVVGQASVPSNKGMKQTKLSSAPTLAPQAALRPEVPPSALQRFALVRTASQLIPGVRRTMRREAA